MLTIGIITVYFNLITHLTPSRILIAGSISLGFTSELIYLLVASKVKFKKSFSIKIKSSPIVFLYEFTLLIGLIVYTYLVIIDNKIFTTSRLVSIALIFITWFISGIFTYQFNSLIKNSNYWRFIWSHFKGYILFIALSSFSVYILKPEGLSSIYPLYISIIYTVCALFLDTTYYAYLKSPETDETKMKLLRASEIFEEPILERIKFNYDKYSIAGNLFNHYLNDQIANIYLKKFKDVYKFIDNSIDLFSFDFRKCVMLRSSDSYNVEVLPDNAIELYMNLHEMNDIRRINEYFINVNSKLISGGVFVGVIEPISLRRRRFFVDYPYYIASVFYFFDFIWKRVFPKLPFLKRFYFALTQGKSRAISLPEALGRLYYCGFELVNFKQIRNVVYFIAVKIGEPLSDENPSYGPFVKLKRIGKDSKLINVYKFRTMYPYSEYLQKFIYEKVNLQKGGKFNNDFRITSYGKIFRELWIDELPMLINWFRGELKLVGVRPLSEHYLSLYTEELRERRKKYKPGLVPPFYYDLPKTLPEIMESEKNYLDQYDKKPFLTDIKYFFKIFINIVFKKARSK
jgi:lipopolysaccharide/colanic/teichoic acid biosynthesis glycosyltransferase